MVGTPFLLTMAKLGLFLGAVGYSFLGAGAATYPPGQWKTIIENKQFTQTLDLDTGDDNTLIINATFYNINGDGITIRNIKNVYIKNCRIHNVSGNGIVLRSTGSTQNVTIDGCVIYNTGQSGIMAKQPDGGGNHTNLVIKNNTVYNTGSTDKDHNIYVQSQDGLIEHNVVYGSSGNGISLRSSGIVRGNRVWDTEKSCIRYYSNHTPGPSNTVYIENNICFQTDPGGPGISLMRAGEAPVSWLAQNYQVRFNTVVSFSSDRYGFAVQSKEFDPQRVEVYGNIFINTKNSSRVMQTQYIDYLSRNYTSTSLKGFVNSTQYPYNLQLTAVSPARYYASAEPHFPPLDINGSRRVAGFLDAGAHQFSGASARFLYLPFILD